MLGSQGLGLQLALWGKQESSASDSGQDVRMKDVRRETVGRAMRRQGRIRRWGVYGTIAVAVSIGPAARSGSEISVEVEGQETTDWLMDVYPIWNTQVHVSNTARLRGTTTGKSGHFT